MRTELPMAPPMGTPRVVVRAAAAVVAKSAVLATRVVMVRVEALLEETTKVTRMAPLMVAAVRRREAGAGYRVRAGVSPSVIVWMETVKALPP